MGLLDTLGDFLRCPTKTPVTIPISAILDLTSRITMILPPRKGSRGQDDTQLNSAIGREEKEELWSVLPDIHVAIMDLLTALVQRMKDNAMPIAAELLHQTVRIFDADQHIPLIRERGYVLIRELLLLHGPTLPKLSVDSLDRVVQSCCKDLLAASGHAPRDQKSGGKDVPSQKNNKKASSSKASSNADAYLKIETNILAAATDLPTTHLEACSALLPVLLSHLPQQHLKQTLRALVDRTAVLSHNRDAMVSSVLNQYRTPNGKALASVFPFLTRDFPRDQAVELLRSNLRAASWSALAAAEEGDDEALLEQLQGESGDQEDAIEEEAALGQKKWASGFQAAEAEDEETAGADDSAPQAGFNLSTTQGPTEKSTSVLVENLTLVSETTVGDSKDTVMLSSTLKRKSEDVEPHAKRIDSGKSPEVFGGAADKMDVVEEGEDEDSDGDSDGSVHLEATLDDDSEDEDED